MLSLVPKLRTLLLFSVISALPGITLYADEKTEPPVPVRTVPPTVPPGFKIGGAGGLVTLNFLVDDKGNVQEATVVKSSHSELEEPALTAIKKWRFKPARKEGNAVSVRVTIPIKFEVT